MVNTCTHTHTHLLGPKGVCAFGKSEMVQPRFVLTWLQTNEPEPPRECPDYLLDFNRIDSKTSGPSTISHHLLEGRAADSKPISRWNAAGK